MRDAREALAPSSTAARDSCGTPLKRCAALRLRKERRPGSRRGEALRLELVYPQRVANRSAQPTAVFKVGMVLSKTCSFKAHIGGMSVHSTCVGLQWMGEG